MSSTEVDKFELNAPSARKAPSAEKVWLLPTNQLNLMFMIASGSVSGPSGFGRKYFTDSLAACPGWIPIFADAVPKHALAQAGTEGKHLRSVIAELDLSSLRGSVQALGTGGSWRTIRFPEELSDSDMGLLIPAPLPATWIRTIHFASRDERAAVEEEATDFANVPLTAHRRRISARLFSGNFNCPWPPEVAGLPDRDLPLHRPSAVGGAMALALALGNRGDETVEAARLMFDPECGATGGDEGKHQVESPLFEAFRRWACIDLHDTSMDLQAQLLLSILSALVDAKIRADAGGSATPLDLHQTVLKTLLTEQGQLREQSSQLASERLAGLGDDLKGVLGLGPHTISELLARHPKPFSRGLLLFFLRERPEDLLELDSPGLNAMDFAVAASLFGARSGWMGLPGDVRNRPGLRDAVSHRMAVLAHRLADSGIDLGRAPERIKPLRELLQVAGGKWGSRQADAALALARGLGWSDLLHTRISLGKGDYRLQVDGRGAHVLLEGDVKAVVTEVHPEALLGRLSKATVPSKLESAVRENLGRSGS